MLFTSLLASVGSFPLLFSFGSVSALSDLFDLALLTLFTSASSSWIADALPTTVLLLFALARDLAERLLSALGLVDCPSADFLSELADFLLNTLCGRSCTDC